MIDRIFIINLKEREDKRMDMIDEMNRLGITNYEFFDAIRPTIDDVHEWNPNFCSFAKKMMSPEKFLNYQIGSLGCLKSHIQVLKICLQRGYQRVMILEDDAHFTEDFDKIFEYSAQIDNKYDMLYLYGNHWETPRSISENIMKITRTLTTSSYIITNKVMEYTTKAIQSYAREIDYFYGSVIHSKFECFCTSPLLTYQRKSFSDIQQKHVLYDNK